MKRRVRKWYRTKSTIQRRVGVEENQKDQQNCEPNQQKRWEHKKREGAPVRRMTVAFSARAAEMRAEIYLKQRARNWERSEGSSEPVVARRS